MTSFEEPSGVPISYDRPEIHPGSTDEFAQAYAWRFRERTATEIFDACMDSGTRPPRELRNAIAGDVLARIADIPPPSPEPL